VCSRGAVSWGGSCRELAVVVIFVRQLNGGFESDVTANRAWIRMDEKGMTNIVEKCELRSLGCTRQRRHDTADKAQPWPWPWLEEMGESCG
jgi:hypothetical protein